MSQLNKQSHKFKDWCCSYALPFWAQNALDIHGGFHEILNIDASPKLLQTRRVRVQARAAYVYAHAHSKKWYNNAQHPSDHAWDYVVNNGAQGGGFIPGDGFKASAHRLNADGSLLDSRRDTYTQAFILLAAAWRFTAFGDKAALQYADKTLAFMDTHLKADNGGWYEGLPRSLPRRQNPHMHMFEALLALYDATKKEKYLRRADAIFDLFQRRFFNENIEILCEFFNDDWSLYDGIGAIEPGHMMEWCWLLHYYEKLSGKNVAIYADTLFASALKYGLNDKLNLICDKVAIENEPIKPTYRTWPQTEFIKASIAQAGAGRPGMETHAAKAIKSLFKYYFQTKIKGGWIDQVDAHGHVLVNVMPTSTFYHIFCAASEVADYVEVQESS